MGDEDRVVIEIDGSTKPFEEAIWRALNNIRQQMQDALGELTVPITIETNLEKQEEAYKKLQDLNKLYGVQLSYYRKLMASQGMEAKKIAEILGEREKEYRLNQALLSLLKQQHKVMETAKKKEEKKPKEDVTKRAGLFEALGVTGISPYLRMKGGRVYGGISGINIPATIERVSEGEGLGAKYPQLQQLAARLRGPLSRIGFVKPMDEEKMAKVLGKKAPAAAGGAVGAALSIAPLLALVGVGYMIYKLLRKMFEVLKESEAYQAMKDLLGGGMKSMIDSFLGPLMLVARYVVQELKGKYTEELQRFIENPSAWVREHFLPTVVGPTIGRFNENLQSVYMDIKATFTGAGESLSEAVNSAFETTKSGLESVQTKLSSFVESAYMTLTDSVKAVSRGLRASASLVSTSLVGGGISVSHAFSQVGGWLQSAFGGVSGWLRLAFSNAGGWLQSAFSGVSGWLQSAFSNVGTWLRTAFSNVSVWLQSAFSNIGSYIRDAVSSAGSSIVDTVSGLLGL